MRIEDVLKELRREMTIILVTNLTSSRPAGWLRRTMFLWNGEVVECDRTDVIFNGQPRDPRTRLRGTACSDERLYPRHSIIVTRDLNLWYGKFQALKQVRVEHPARPDHLADRPLRLRQDHPAALLQPRQRALRLRHHHRRDPVLGKNIYDPDVSLVELRKSVGMVFQRPNPLPLSVYENVVFGLRIHHRIGSELKLADLDDRGGEGADRGRPVERSQGPPARPATSLQLEQQQKLCIARLLPLKPRSS
jgi:ABC-type phosphate transport system ATPase subunit